MWCPSSAVQQFTSGSAGNEKWNGKPRLACVNARHPPFKNPVRVAYCPGHAGVKGNYIADGLAGKATITGRLRALGRSEAVRSLRQSGRAQRQGHHTIDHTEERGVERGNAQRSSFRGRERTIANQTNIGTVSRKGNIGETHERRGGAHMGLPVHMHTSLN